ncbi:MAG: hypothetical protein ACXVHX_02335 [Solirubrobacteraceae bacterium]
MAIYFAAATDGAALDALTAPRDGAEAFETTISPGSDAFTFLVELIRGDTAVEDPVAARIAEIDTSVDDVRLVRLGALVRDGIADADQSTIQDLAGLWAANAGVKKIGIDAEAFLTDLQHLCRNACAGGADVYVLERF